jgi:ADP-ribose pyrophosphatase
LGKAQARVVSSKVMYTGPVFGVRRDRVVEPGGVASTRDVVTHNGSVVLLPIFPDGRLLLVRQYRHAVGVYLWELVAGRIEPGELPLAAARRELIEETGYTARRFRKLLDVFPTPGFVSERMVVYVVERLTAGNARPDADERIRARHFSLQQLEIMIRRGRLRDAKSIAGILYYARFCRQPFHR